MRVEVAVRQEDEGEVRILLVSSGTRRPAPDAPAWLLGQGEIPWAEGTIRYLQLCDFFDRAPDFVLKLVDPGKAVDEDRLLDAAAAYLDSELASLLFGLALVIACEPSARSTRAPPLGRARIALLRDIYARALRSVPFEHLATSAILRPGFSLFTRLRYQRIGGALVRDTLDESRADVGRWLNEIAIEPAPSRENALAGAFGAILGRLDNYETLVRESQILPGVIRATRFAMTVRDPSPDLIERSIASLRGIAGDLVDRKLDIPLARAAEFASD